MLLFVTNDNISTVTIAFPLVESLFLYAAINSIFES